MNFNDWKDTARKIRDEKSGQTTLQQMVLLCAAGALFFIAIYEILQLRAGV